MTPLVPAPRLHQRAPSLERHTNAYLVGIGGTGMCGAAELLRARGLAVRGSDAVPSRRTQRLERMGIGVDYGESPAALPGDTTLLVVSAAVPSHQAQVAEAARRGVEVWKYADCLGALMHGKTGIAVAGCHGKTTTSSLVATTLHRAGRDPSFVIGGEVRDLATSARPGRGAHFVVEACEFDRSFHRLEPRIAIVTNLDADHLDYYRDLEEIRESFRDFARLLPADGLLVVHEDHAEAFRRDPLRRSRLLTYGVSAGADWRAVDVWWDARDQVTRWRLLGPEGAQALFHVPLAGHHNVLNATAAAAALVDAGLSLEEVAGGMAPFGGVGRRMERVAEAGGVLVLDDYGHHPTEISAVVRAARSRWDGRRLVVVFQPHQASRTRQFLAQFGAALAEADEVWLPPIFFARDSEEDRRIVSSQDVAARVVAAGGRALAFESLEAVLAHAVDAVRPGDVVVTMGAGNVDEVARGLAGRLR